MDIATTPRPGDNPLREALQYWESRRLGYNLALTAVTLGWVRFTWPHFRPVIDWQHGGMLLVLAVAANVCYCAAYPVELAGQLSPFANAWRRHRWMLWTLGTLLGVLFACYWIADEIYPYVGFTGQ